MLTLPEFQSVAPWYYEWMRHPPGDPWWDWASLEGRCAVVAGGGTGAGVGAGANARACQNDSVMASTHPVCRRSVSAQATSR